MSALPDVQPNFTISTTQGSLLIVFNAIFTVLMTIAVLIRFYVKLFLTRSIGWDDYTCGFAAILSWIQTGLRIHAVFLGYGTLMSASNLVWIQATTPVYPAALGAIKISILLLYYRIFAVNKTFRSIVVGSIVFITLVSILFTILTILTVMDCSNLVSNPICDRGTYVIILSLGVFCVITDFWLLFLPMRSILNLHLEKHRKIGLVVVFGTAAITCLVSLTRTIYYSRTFSSTNSFWIANPTAELMIVEVNVGIIVACSSTLPKFYASAKAFTSSVYQSFNDRTSRFDSSVEKSKVPILGSDDGSETRLNDIRHETNSGVSHSPTVSRNN